MNANRKDDAQPESIEQLEDLGGRGEEVRNAEHVKGGFNPQPEPPGVPVFQAPVYRPVGIVR